jgi:uncharacterized protein
MARVDGISAGRADAGVGPADGWACYELGVMYSAGREVAVDRVTAHKWLNIAAMRGCREAVTLRSELAVEMTAAEIAAAQREARLWLNRA